MAVEELRVEPARALVGHIAVQDYATATPFVVASLLLAGSELTIHDVPLAPERTGLLDVLERMGARIAIFNRRREAGSPAGDVEVRATPLVAATVKRGEAQQLVDELALFAVAAGSAHGDSVVHGLDEQEWVEGVTIALRALGIRVSRRDDGLGVRGVPTRPKGGGMDARGDPRLAVAGVVAGLVSREGVRLRGADAAAVTFPGLLDLLESVTQR